MKKFLLFVYLTISAAILSAQVTATYSAGDIPTGDGAYDPACNGPLTTLVVTIPAGDFVTSVDVTYNMTAAGGAWMSEQQSQIACQDTGLDEGGFFPGTGGNSAGTETYTRTGLTLANGVDADGILTFEMRAFRTWSGTAGCLTTNNKVDDGTWTITVNHIPPPSCLPPSNGSVSNILGTSCDIGWMENGTAAAWDLEYGITGFTPTGTPSAGYDDITNPVNVSGLTAVTTYDVYYRADCGMDNTNASVWVGPITFTTACATFVAPYTEAFDNTTIPLCWVQSATTGGPWAFSGTFFNTVECSTAPVDHSNNGGNYAALDHSGTDAGVILEMPNVDVSALTVPFLDLYHSMCLTGYSPGNDTYIEAFDGTTWNQVAVINTGTGAWENYGYDLTPYVYNTNIVTLRFRAESGGSGSDFYGDIALDDISIIEAPSCPAPANIAVTNVTSNSADIDFLFSGPGTSFIVEYGPLGFTPGTGAGTQVTFSSAPPYALTGLPSSSDLQVYVLEECGPADQSIFTGPVNFATACTVFTAPFLEEFNGTAIPNCWTEAAASGGPWAFPGTFFNTVECSPAPVDHTGNGGNFAALDHSGADAGVILQLPLIDVSALSVPYLDFWLSMCTTGYTPPNETFIEAYDGTTWNQVGVINTGTGAWENHGFSIAGFVYNTNLVNIRFRAESGGSTNDFYGDIAIDDVSVDEAPSCPAPVALAVTNVTSTTADVDFSGSGPGNNFTVEYGPIGFTPGTGAGTQVTFTTPPPYTLTGLPSSSDLQIYVLEECGPADVSGWTGPATFATACTVFIAPFLEEFNGTAIPNCWTEAAGSGGPWAFPGTFFNTVQCPVAPTDHSNNGGNYAALDHSGTDVGVILQLPLIDVSALSVPYLDFWLSMCTAGYTPANETFIEAFDGTTWNQVGVINTGSGTWENHGFDISSFVYNTNLVNIRFRAESGGSTADFNGDIAIDDVEIDEAPSCPAPVAFTVTNVTATTADLDFSYSGPGTTFIAEYGPLGFNPGTGAGTQVTFSAPLPYTITGLPSSSDLQLYIYEECAVADISDWTGPATIQTACTAINTYPACEEFTGTSIPNCWTMTGQDDWEFSTNAGYGAIPAGDHTGNGGNYAWMDGSDADPGDLNALVTPFYDVSSLNAAYLSYWVFTDNIDNPGDNNTLYVELWDGASWIPVDTISTDSPVWVEYTVNVNAFATVTGPIQFQFIFESTTTGNDFFNDILIDDVCVKELPLDDMGVTDIMAPTSGCGLGMEDITIEVSNLGFLTQGGFFTGYSVNGVVQTAIPDGFISSNIVSGASETYTFTTQYDFSAIGAYTIQAWTELPGDSDATNDTTTIIINNSPLISSLPYFEDFETSDGGFIATDDSGNGSIWEWGAPTGTTINTANSGVNVWATDLDSDHVNNTTTFLESPCMDFSSLSVDPELSFALRTDTETNFDGMSVDVSVDGGSTWTILGTDSDPGWYNNADQQFQGDNGAWTTVTHTLDGTAGEGSVAIRFVFDSDGSGNNNGVAIDDVGITDICAAGFGLTGSSTDESIQGTSLDGTATVTPGAGGNFSYEWNDPAGQTTGTATGLSDGVYSVTVTDAQGCKDIVSVTVGYTCLASFIDDVTYTEESQNGTTADGTATVNAASPAPPYDYAWSSGDTSTGDMTGVNTITSLTAGLYYVTVTDGNGCMDVDSIVVTAFCPVSLGATTSVVNETVLGNADGTATVTPNTGLAPYTYAWNTGGTMATESNLTAGTYTVTITDSNDCTEVVTVDMETSCPQSLGGTATPLDETLVNENDGAVSASASAGLPPYQFDWDNGNVGNTITNLTPGNYIVTITDANGCAEVLSATVNAGTINTPTEEIESLTSFLLAPNPTTGATTLSVRFSESVDLHVDVMNVVGQQVYTQRFNNTNSEDIRIDLEGQAAGIYFVRLMVGVAVHKTRVLKK